MVDQLRESATGLGARSVDVKEQALEFAATAREQFSGVSRTLKTYIDKEPVRALGIALGMGVLLGWLIKRR